MAALQDDTRGRLYRFVSEAAADVSRDEAALQLGLTRRVAAFNLDALVEQGLLEVTFRRQSGRRGPGAGRPSKLYRRADVRLDVSLPPRNYELLARLLASLAESQVGGGAIGDLASGAGAFGAAIGAVAREEAGPRAGRKVLRQALMNRLGDEGFEPFVDEAGTIRLRNCPFHEMAQENRELVCELNLRMMRGVSDAVGGADLEPILEPREGTCCVAFRPQHQSRRA